MDVADCASVVAEGLAGGIISTKKLLANLSGLCYPDLHAGLAKNMPLARLTVFYLLRKSVGAMKPLLEMVS